MTFRIIVEPTAERAIREAFRWIQVNRSDGAAIAWFNAIERSILTLSQSPRRHPIAAESEKFAEEIRELLHGRRRPTHRILFTIRQETVHVLYVRHVAQDDVEP